MTTWKLLTDLPQYLRVGNIVLVRSENGVTATGLVVACWEHQVNIRLAGRVCAFQQVDGEEGAWTWTG